jgi:hypothetical protein
MGTAIKRLYSYEMDASKTSAWKKFISWCDSQEKYRIGWKIVTITLHGCVLTIFTMCMLQKVIEVRAKKN